MSYPGYAQGGYVGPGLNVSIKLGANECVLGWRDDGLYCLRADHKHDAAVITRAAMDYALRRYGDAGPDEGDE